jgi:hypothetical protein
MPDYDTPSGRALLALALLLMGTIQGLLFGWLLWH